MFSGLEVRYPDINVSAPPPPRCLITSRDLRAPVQRKLSGGVVSHMGPVWFVRWNERVRTGRPACGRYVVPAQELAEWPAIHSYRTRTWRPRWCSGTRNSPGTALWRSTVGCAFMGCLPHRRRGLFLTACTLSPSTVPERVACKQEFM